MEKNEEDFRQQVYDRYKNSKFKIPTIKHKHKIVGRTQHPLIKKLQKQFEEWFIFGDIEDICEKFKVSESRLQKLIYSDKADEHSMLDFDTIIKLSNMFNIPYEDFVDYNAYIEHTRQNEIKTQEEENEMLKQYAVGKEWEDNIIKYYSDRNYFVYKIPTMNSGTVFDIIAVHNGAALMIECKHIESDKLYYASSGILKKRDELDHFVESTGNNIYIYVKSDKSGTWWTTWVNAKEVFEKKGYISREDCFSCKVD